MIDYGGKDLADAFRTVRKNTIQIAEDIPEDQYDFRAVPESRSVRETLAHIGASPQFQLHVHANKITDMATVNFVELFQKFSAEENKARSKGDVIAYLKSDGDIYGKGAYFLHTLRYLIGDEKFFKALHHMAYPTKLMETYTDGRQERLVTTLSLIHISEPTRPY